MVFFKGILYNDKKGGRNYEMWFWRGFGRNSDKNCLL